MRIELNKVNYAYADGHQALKDVDLSINSGELVVLIGHSGSGKSTLSLLLAGLYEPSSGKICLEGGSKQGNFSGVGLVFQYPEDQLFAETVYEEVSFGPKNLGVPEDCLPQMVRQALDAVGLDPERYWHQSPFLLSGGQQRRVCLASLLAMYPDVLVLDEPAAGLDQQGRRWVMDLVRDLHAKGHTIIWVTHDMTEAAELGERIIVLDQGRILLDGTPKEVFQQESLLQEVGLDIPSAAAVVRQLRNAGIMVPGEAITSAEAAVEISQWLEHRASNAQGGSANG